VTVRPQVWVGIDVGKSSHHACAVDETGKMAWTQKLANEQAAIEALIDRAQNTAVAVRWAIDLTSPMALMLITVLLAAGESVVYVPGRMVNTMTGAFRGEGKTDAKDSRVIAETARMRTDLAAVTMPDELVVELTQLTGYRTDVMADWVRGINRLRSLLGSIFPALEAAFDYSTRTPLILVAGLCTPAEIRAAGTEGVMTHLAGNKAWAPGIAKTATTAVALANAQHLALPGQAGTAALVKRIAAKLLELDREIKDLDKTIAERFRDHPYARIIESLPGFGPNLGGRVPGGHPRRSDVIRYVRSAGVLRRIGAGATGFRSRHGQSTKAETVQPPAAAGVLSGRTVEPAHHRAVAAVL
jgi:transposase